MRCAYPCRWLRNPTSSISICVCERVLCCMAQTKVRVNKHEEERMRKLHAGGLGVGKIAVLMGRSKDTVSKKVFKKIGPAKPLGRPPKMSVALWKKTGKTYATMIRKADSKKEVTAKLIVKNLKTKFKVKVSTRTLGRAFKKNGVRFRPLYEKPTLTDADRKERKDFADEMKNKSAAQWQRSPKAMLDNKNFPVYCKGKARDDAARRRVRGAYRGKGAKVTKGHTKPPKHLKSNTGARSAIISCAIGAGRVLMWHEVKGRWNGTAASEMYSGPLLHGLQRAYPTAPRSGTFARALV